jgi:hypothetical protein
MKVGNGLDLQSQKITNAADGTANSDAATWGQVQNAINGVAWKEAVRAASTTNGTLATAFANGQVLDGVTLATNDRILLKNQTTGSENGVYVVPVSGAPTRAVDADSSADLDGMGVYVTQGTANADKSFTLTTDAPITVGTTALVYAQFGGGQNYLAGNGLQLASTTFAVLAADSSIVVAGGGISTSRGAIGATGKYTATLGAITGGTPLTVTHNLGSQYVVAKLYIESTQEEILADIILTGANTLTVTVATSQGSGFYRIVVVG